MLGYVNERFPATGALGPRDYGRMRHALGEFCAANHRPNSTTRVLLRNIPEGQTLAGLSSAPAGSELAELWTQVQNAGGLSALQSVCDFAHYSSSHFLH